MHAAARVVLLQIHVFGKLDARHDVFKRLEEPQVNRENPHKHANSTQKGPQRLLTIV